MKKIFIILTIILTLFIIAKTGFCLTRLSIPNGGSVELDPKKEYYVEETIEITNTIIFNGNKAMIYCYSSVGNNPALIFSGEGSVISNLKIDCSQNHTDGNDNDFQDAGDSFEYNFRGAVRIIGDNIKLENIEVYDAPAGVSFINSYNCSVTSSYFKNQYVNNNSPYISNYNTAVLISGCTKIEVFGSEIDGFGQGVLIGTIYGNTYDINVHNNRFVNQSNNGVYNSSGEKISICENDIKSFYSSGIKVHAREGIISHNTIVCNESQVNSAITASGSGSVIENIFNGKTIIISKNNITGDATAGICIDEEDGYYLKSPMILNNSILFNIGSVRPCYGIHLKNVVTEGVMIKGNKIRECSYGLLATGVASYYSLNATIINNDIVESSNDAIVLAKFKHSLITNNQGKSCDQYRVGLVLNDSYHNNVFMNDFGDDKDISTQRYGIEEENGSDYNVYIYNDLEGVTSFKYRNLGPNSITVDIY